MGMTYTGDISSQQIEDAIDCGEMVLHYQPQTSLISGEIVGIEALTRWDSPTLGYVDTADLINVLERSDQKLITKFHEWSIRTACPQILAWQKIDIVAPVYLNFSTRYLQERNCLNSIIAILEEYDVKPTWIGIEVTESCAVTNINSLKFVLENLHAMGIKIALDDFCTGYGSLEYLIDLPADKIKIDKQFVQGLISESPQRHAAIMIILESLVEMAFNLKKEVVAEGVETTKQLELLTLMGCDAYQGYFFCPPVPPNLIPGFIEKTNNPKAFNLASSLSSTEAILEAIAA